MLIGVQFESEDVMQKALYFGSPEKLYNDFSFFWAKHFTDLKEIEAGVRLRDGFTPVFDTVDVDFALEGDEIPEYLKELETELKNTPLPDQFSNDIDKIFEMFDRNPRLYGSRYSSSFLDILRIEGQNGWLFDVLRNKNNADLEFVIGVPLCYIYTVTMPYNVEWHRISRTLQKLVKVTDRSASGHFWVFDEDFIVFVTFSETSVYFHGGIETAKNGTKIEMISNAEFIKLVAGVDDSDDWVFALEFYEKVREVLV